jgi:hypothetical protein
MSIFDLFSKRQKRLRGEISDVFTYGSLPNSLRVQIVHVWNDALGNESDYWDKSKGVEGAYKLIVDVLCREYGQFRLVDMLQHDRDYRHELIGFLLAETDSERQLDAVEVSCRAIDRHTRDYRYLRRQEASKYADGALLEINQRFREHGIGFEYSDGEIIRIDSAFVHEEAVKPALIILRGTMYAGAQEEFLKAYEFYRHSNEKEALANCLKCLESVLKAICKKRSWSCPPNATSSALLQLVFERGLIPQFWQQHFSALRSTIESGVPTARNRLGGHGQGDAIIQVPDYLVSYALHATAAAVLFLANAEQAMK